MAENNKTVDRIQAVWNLLGGEEGVDRFIQGDQVATNRSNLLLLGSLRLTEGPITFQPLGGIFVGHHFFAEGCNHSGVLIHQVDDSFKERFYDVQEVSRTVGVVTVRVLEKSMRSTQILAALGDKDIARIRKCDITLEHLHLFLRTAGIVNTFICYIADKKGVVQEVRIDGAMDGGWRFSSPDIEDPEPWAPLHKVISAA